MPYSDRFQLFTPKQIASLRTGGAILRDCLKHVAAQVKPGITTGELDRIAEQFILERGGKPAFKGYHGFPATLCISVNDVVVHGIPGPLVIKPGDIVSLDGGVIYDKLYTDACVTVPVGNVGAKMQTFLDVTSSALEDVIKQVVKPGARIGDISSFLERRLEAGGYTVVRQLTGHGLGSTLHQYPDVPNFGTAGEGPVLPLHTIIAIEPIASLRSGNIVTDDDNWTIRTVDGSWACHFEHTVLTTEEGCEIIA
jgi:methionyl aminopeptidase